MGVRRALVGLVAAALLGAGTLAAATAATSADAQVKAAVAKGITAVAHQKGSGLATAVAKARTALTAAAPTSASAKSAKTLALQGLAKAALAAGEEVKAENANTRMDYGTANSQTALAAKNTAAAGKLLDKAAVLLGLKA
jgi:hypothetical protein